MKIENIDIEATVKKAKDIIRNDEHLPLATKSIVEILIMIITLLVNRLNLNCKNSNMAPSSDPCRKKVPRSKTGKKPGGQKGHAGITLKKVDEPDHVELIEVDRNDLPPGRYREIGFETRQVVDISISRVVTEYRAQVLKNDAGKRFVASFPSGVTKAVQYGPELKAHSVYMSQFQLIVSIT